MGAYVAGQLIKKMLKRGVPVAGARVLIMGLAFKENCPDLRNTRVTDVIAELKEFGAQVDVFDPWVSAEEAKVEYNIDLVNTPIANTYGGILLAVAHDQFIALGGDGIRQFGTPNHVLYDLKYILPADASDWRL